ncbi:MAG TPA: OsmC family protein [Thermoguttaceae bacterium]|nr:OsmC family protein [Thermoguttaceae bacterium]
MGKQALQTLNGIDTDALRHTMHDVSRDPSKGLMKLDVATSWTNGPRCETSVTAFEIGGQTLDRNFTIPIDEPRELLGTDTAPNAQEVLMAAVNACMVAGYVAGCSLKGIELESLHIETHGELDLRGFLGIEKDVAPGYEEIHQTVRIKGNGTAEQFREVHETVKASSPNYFNMTHPVTMHSELIVEQLVVE